MAGRVAAPDDVDVFRVVRWRQVPVRLRRAARRRPARRPVRCGPWGSTTSSPPPCAWGLTGGSRR
ncbi:hypothetical protein FRAAL3992 [Frankia alni ACN14a]|uniref:Uncharacterized protein n=1 Tax=Frankia alni (strain DSM 45986 / CECT 9034 / ACN14a) TaxID=326424 RepID=Q0RIN4_FRAAA|nr:hypothetical protein FRAAL3992 [Frankia alni ACN14a]